jgi:long-chain acyl-CoA synthetase
VRTETLPQLLLAMSRRRGAARTAMRRKEYGIWQRYTWGDYVAHVRAVSLGLVALGIQPGDRIAIVGENDPEWYWAEIGAQAAGAIAFGIFSDSIPAEIRYYLEQSEASIVFAHDQEQADKVFAVADGLPNLRRIVYWDSKGLWFYDHPLLMPFADVEALGRQLDRDDPELFERNVGQGKPTDIAVLCYTSGTTGAPKAAMLSHQAVVQSIVSLVTLSPIAEEDEYVSFIPPAWATEQYLGIAGQLVYGFTVNFAEEPETVRADLREIGPQLVVYTTRLWEAICSEIQAEMGDARGLKRLVYRACRAITDRAVDREVSGRSLSLPWRALRAAADRLCFRGIRDQLGLLHTRDAFTGGAPLGPENFRLVRSHGINLKQIYGLTETGFLTAHPDGNVRPETLGRPLPGAEVAISPNGEIIARSGAMFSGYFKAPDRAAEKWLDDWYRTGDGGMFDDAGHLVYLDRLDEFRALADGQPFAPSYIETRLRFSPFIKDCLCVGGPTAPHVAAIVNIDYANVGRWAEGRGLSYTTFSDLSQKPEVYQLIEHEIATFNRRLPPAMRVLAFALLSKELDPDEGELTRTRKLRRTFLEQRQQALIEALYGEAANFPVETSVVYRDGRRGTVRTTIALRRLAP